MRSRASGAICLDAFFAVSENARNMPLVGPNLQLVPDVDPADGWFDVMWIEGKERKALQDYLELRRRDERAIAPAKTRRCQRVLFRYVDAPAHVDGKAFLSLAIPIRPGKRLSTSVQRDVLYISTPRRSPRTSRASIRYFAITSNSLARCLATGPARRRNPSPRR
jgi:hypothetical protein